MSDITTVIVDQENVNDETVTFVAWSVACGEWVEQNQVLGEVETSKTTVEIVAPTSGFVQFRCTEGDELAVGSAICWITPEKDQQIPEITASETPANNKFNQEGACENTNSNESPRSTCETKQNGHQSHNGTKPRFSQRALRLIEQHRVSPSQFDDHGLVRERDVRHVLNGNGYSNSSNAGPALESQKPHRPAYRLEEIPHAKRVERKLLAAGLQETLPSVVTLACPTAGLRSAIDQQAPFGDNASALIIFETARLLAAYPMFNAFYQDGQVAYYDAINVGFAVDAGHGLKVPVIRHANQKGLHELADEQRRLIVDYVNDELSVESLTDATFTVTDLSGEDVFTFHPLISHGQSAILGIGGEFFAAGSDQGFFNLILAFDHQVSDGRTAARFLKELRDRLTNYEAALMGRTADQGRQVREAQCNRCSRTGQELQQLDAYLVKSALPAGCICSICLAGN